MNVRRIAAIAAATALCGVAFAQAPIPHYGSNVTLDQARRAAAAAEFSNWRRLIIQVPHPISVEDDATSEEY